MIARKPASILTAASLALALAACQGSKHQTTTASSEQSAPPAFASISPTACGTYNGRGCQPTSARVDLGKPVFSHPTQITNPMFPIGRLRSAVLLGHAGHDAFRSETTLLPGTQTITWNGQRVQVRLSQYTAYVNGHLDEVALDRYAQADDGSVWYFGEDVFDYRKGGAAITEGTWLAGREGPAAMIMPAHPKAGDVFRLENIPGIVFEEVTIKSVGDTVPGPRGPVTGALLADEFHSDGSTDHKVYAPGYGEFRTTGSGDLEALAVAAPADAHPGPPPLDLESLSLGANGILESARIKDWSGANGTLQRMQTAWRSVQARKPPPLVATQLDDALGRLAPAVRAHKAAAVEQAAVDVSQSVLDLQLMYRPPLEIDAARFELRTQQLRLDAAANNLAAVTGDVATLEWMRERFAYALTPAGRADVDARLQALRSAADAKNPVAAGDQAARLGARLRNLMPAGPA
jgi:hypothetical protein